MEGLLPAAKYTPALRQPGTQGAQKNHAASVRAHARSIPCAYLPHAWTKRGRAVPDSRTADDRGGGGVRVSQPLSSVDERCSVRQVGHGRECEVCSYSVPISGEAPSFFLERGYMSIHCMKGDYTWTGFL